MSRVAKPWRCQPRKAAPPKAWRSNRAWLAIGASLLLIAPGAEDPRAQGRQATVAGRVDTLLAERLDRLDDTVFERVIITVKPGAKRRLLRSLQAQGERVDVDFGVIDAFAGRIPRRLLRQLRNHPDVVSLSTDAQVTSMQVSSPVGTVYTVTNTNNSGTGSLRQAITDANGRAGADTIYFNIGTGAKTITVTSGLPTITGPVVIDATSQPGFAGTPLIRVDGNSTEEVSGLVLSSTSDDSVIRGLIITRFEYDGITIQAGADNITIAGNWVGTAGTATTGTGNGDAGIELAGSRAVIGGTGPYDGNVITNNGDEGITVVGSGVTSHAIRGNYIGLDPDGSTGAGNTDVGIAVISGSGNTIGGTTAAARNVISKNYEGIEVNTSNNVVQGNYVGTDATGALARGNRLGDGIQIQGSSTANLVGGTEPGAGNLIAFNALDGVNVVNGSSHAVVGNSIFGNSGLGIDLAASGVLTNDTGDGDGGANRKQNYPVLTKAVTTGNLVEITGTLNSTANRFFRLEFFSSPTADSTTNGEGQTYLGFVNVATTSSGNASFVLTLPAPVAAGAVVSATATKTTSTYSAFTDTSEFARNVAATLAPYSLRSTLTLDAATSSTPTTPRTGAGVTVAVIDSGLVLDGGGTKRIKTTRDFTTGSANPPAIAPLDGYGHGTHVAGVIGSDQAEGMGVAPGVSYVSLRVLNSLGVGSTSHVITAIEWAVANKATYGIDIINLSLGHPIFEPAATDPLVQAVEAAVRAGIVVVSSAGNFGTNPLTGQVGYAGISSPGNAPSSITVGALRTQDTARRSDDVVAEYSSRGPTWYDGYAKPDVIAPGHRLVGPAATDQTLYTLFPSNRLTLGGRPYLKLSGTSMAASVVSGSVALMLEQARASFGATPTPNAVKAMLQHTAFTLTDAAGAAFDALTQGAGAVNPAGALELACAIDPTAPVNGPWLVSGVTESTTVDGQHIVWGEQVVWGEHIVWGESVYTHRPAWAANVVWGDAAAWGEPFTDASVVWGGQVSWASQIVWGEHIVWGEQIVWGDALVWRAIDQLQP